MRYNTSKYHRLIHSFAGKKVLVIGDLLLDKYLQGNSSRLCPEAPVPVVDVHQTRTQLGGAANTACNLAALGAEVYFCSVTGADQAAAEARALLRKQGIDITGVVEDNSRITQTKSRVVSGNQLITRIDQGSTDPVDERITRRLYQHLQKWYAQCDAVIISDYDKGVITSTLLQGLRRLRYHHPNFLAVDSKRLTFFSVLRPDCVKPNYDEALKLIGLQGNLDNRVAELASHADTLKERTKAETVLLTLDTDGVLVIDRGNSVTHFPAPQVRQPQVSGAGDSFLSGFVLARLGGGEPDTHAEIAVATASIAVGKECTATCTQGELKRYFNIHVKYITGIAELRDVCEACHAAGRRIVFTNGCFDILHSGHVSYLHRARALGDLLIVGLNDDGSIRRLKGEGRPINSLVDRLQVLAGLSAVDYIIAFGSPDDDTPIPLIRTIRPHIFAKGGDYTREALPEAQVVEACGGKVVLLDHVPDHSTTRIINRIRKQSGKPSLVSDDQHGRLEKL